MKKHKTEFIALVLLLGVLCYAFYDSNIEGKEQEFILSNDLLSMRTISSKEDITMEMLKLPTDELLKLQEEVKEENKEEMDNLSEEETSTIMQDNIEATLLSNNYIPYNEIISNQVINYAKKFIGYPYVYGGNSLTNGTDCSGFTKLIYAEFGINLNRSAYDQLYNGTPISFEEMMPGDLVFSGYDGMVGHVAIYVGNERLVHALNSNVGIVETSLYIMPILAIRRVI